MQILLLNFFHLSEFQIAAILEAREKIKNTLLKVLNLIWNSQKKPF